MRALLDCVYNAASSWRTAIECGSLSASVRARRIASYQLPIEYARVMSSQVSELFALTAPPGDESGALHDSIRVGVRTSVRASMDIGIWRARLEVAIVPPVLALVPRRAIRCSNPASESLRSRPTCFEVEMNWTVAWLLATTPAPNDTLVLPMPPVVVPATRTPESAQKTPAAITVVNQSRFRDTRSLSLQDPLTFVPGVFVQSRSGGQDVRVTIRGFGARGNGERSNTGN